MKAYFLLFFLSINVLSFASEMAKKDLSQVIVTRTGEPTPALCNILASMKVTHDNTLSSMSLQTQKWLRPAHKERWEIEKDNISIPQNIQKQLQDLHVIGHIKPRHKNYNCALLFGSELNDIRHRLAYLIRLWDAGIRFNSLFVLTGERLLDKNIENEKTIAYNFCEQLPVKKDWQWDGIVPFTETEMIKVVFEQSLLPHEWNTLPIIFVDAPMQKKSNGEMRRPNTYDTVNEWIAKHYPMPQSVLAISQQPYVGYQDAVLRKCLLSSGCIVETVGDADYNNEPLALVLDVLARWIYVENQIREQKNSVSHKKTQSKL